MSNLFNVNDDDMPEGRPTQVKSSTQPTQNKFNNNTLPPEEMENLQPIPKKYIIGIVLAVGIVLAILYTPSSKLKNESVQTTTVESIPEEVQSNIVKDLDISTLESSTESLQWVNYEKQLISNQNHTLNFRLNCTSSLMGNFVVELNYEEYIELDESGILPLMVTEHKYKGLKDTYYNNFRLPDNWRELLNGKTD